MADNSTLPATGDIIAADDIGGTKFQRIKLVFGPDGTNSGDVEPANGLPVQTVSNAKVSTANSSTANLAGGAAFTGTSEDVTEYATITVSIFTSHVSATDGLSIQQSSDNANWDQFDVFTIPAAAGKSFQAPVQGRYFRLVYTNGATLTTSLRIQTLLSKSIKRGSALRPQDARANDNDFEENLSYLMGYNGTSWDRLRSTMTNGLMVQDSTNVIDSSITGQGSQLTLNNNVILATAGAGSFDAVGYRTIALQVNVAAGTVTAGVITFEGSNDGTTFVALPLYDTASLTANPVSSYTLAATTTRFFRGPLSYRYFRARISTGVTGTTTGVQAFSRFSPETFYAPQQVVSQATAANLNITVGGGTLPAVTTVSTVTAVNSSTPVTPTTQFVNSAASTNATSTKTSAGTVWSIQASNINAALRYLKLYNKASAPTVGTDVPVMVIPIPIGGQVQIDGGSNGFRFATGIAFAITAAAADTDATAVSASEHKIAITYT